MWIFSKMKEENEALLKAISELQDFHKKHEDILYKEIKKVEPILRSVCNANLSIASITDGLVVLDDTGNEECYLEQIKKMIEHEINEQ